MVQAVLLSAAVTAMTGYRRLRSGIVVTRRRQAPTNLAARFMRKC